MCRRVRRLSVDMPKRNVPYEEALDVVRRGLRPMGEKYLEDLDPRHRSRLDRRLRKRRKDQRRLFPSGSYDGVRAFFLNYNNQFKDAFTIVHELGHSMNSYYTEGKNSRIFTGDIPFSPQRWLPRSTSACRCTICWRDCTDRRGKALSADDLYRGILRATVLRQTMFAEFELAVRESGGKRRSHDGGSSV